MAFSAGAAHSQGDPPAPEQLSKLSFSRSFAGQLAPPLPAECERRALKTSCGNLIDSGEAVWQRGPYSSLWVRLSCSLPAAPCSELRAHVDAALTAQAAMRAPVYVTLPESSLNGKHIECLLSAGFAFHHYRLNVRALHPGVRAACHTFLPHRKPDAVREVKEEVGLTVDETFSAIYLGGWQKARARDQLINDNFSLFAVKALPGDVVVDGTEIVEAKWFPIDDLLRIGEAA
ncbi:MAG: hypothetical protein SGPRY_002549, partial [Prymnesium sp.]